MHRLQLILVLFEWLTPLSLLISHTQTDRQTDRQTERQTDRQTDRKTDRQTDRQMDQGTKSETELWVQQAFPLTHHLLYHTAHGAGLQTPASKWDAGNPASNLSTVTILPASDEVPLTT